MVNRFQCHNYSPDQIYEVSQAVDNKLKSSLTPRAMLERTRNSKENLHKKKSSDQRSKTPTTI